MTRILSLFCCAISVANISSAQSICFDPAEDNRYATALGCYSVTSADFDEDGKMDVVASITYNAGGLMMLKGQGDGRFDAASTISGMSSNQLESADMNDDGHADIVGHHMGMGGAFILFGNGDGSFGEPLVMISPDTDGSYYNKIELGDVNGDGVPDIFIGGTDSNTVRVMLNDGDGAFSEIASLAVTGSANFMDSGDLDGDGDEDFACGYNQSSDGITVFFNNGGGTFGAGTNVYAGTPVPNYMTVQFIDLDGDYDNDICVGGMTTLYMLENDGDGGFTSMPDVFIGSYPNGMAAGDWDDDGDQDLTWPTDTGGSIGVVLNDGDGTFPAYGNTFFSTHGEPRGFTVNDFNNDGIEDVVSACPQQGYITFTEGNGDGTFGSRTLITAYGASGICAGDFDNDDDVDVIGVNYYFSELSVNLNNGDGTFADSYFLPGGSGADEIIAAHFDDDNNLDLALHGNDGFYVFMGQGNGQFDAAVQIIATVQAGSDHSIAAGDFDNDGNLDLAGGIAAGDNLMISFGNGDGTFDAVINIAAADYPRSVATGKLNNDNYDDIVLSGNESNNILVFMSNGNGTFANVLMLAADGNPDGVTVFDADDDGKQDIAAACSNTNELRIYTGNGNGTFDAALVSIAPDNSNMTELTHADINGDGNEDVIASLYQLDAGAVFLGNGDGTFQPANIYPADQRSDGVAAADFNGDGFIDISVLNSGSNNISVILNNAAFISANGPTAFCDDDAVTLTASDSYSYHWSNDETTQSISVAESGTYSCELTNQAGTCTRITPAIDVQVYPITTVTLDLSVDETCISQDPFSLYGGAPFGGQYSGDGIDFNVQFDPAAAGLGQHTITYSYEDIAGCTSGNATAMINVVNSPSVSFEPFADNSLCDTDAPLVFTGGMPEGGEYLVSGVPYESFDPAVFGTGSYDVAYQYSLGEDCSATVVQSLSVEICDRVAEENEEGISVFPSLTTGAVTITARDIKHIDLFDMQGKLLRTFIVNANTMRLDVSEFVNGIYVLRIKTHEVVSISRIEKTSE